MEGPSRSLTSETSAQEPLHPHTIRMLVTPLSCALLPSPPLQRSSNPGHRPTPPPKPWREAAWRARTLKLLAPFPLWGCIFCCRTWTMHTTPSRSIYYLWRMCTYTRQNHLLYEFYIGTWVNMKFYMSCPLYKVKHTFLIYIAHTQSADFCCNYKMWLVSSWW